MTSPFETRDHVFPPTDRIAELEAENARLTAAYGTASRGFAEAHVEIERLTAALAEDWTALAVDLRKELNLPPDADRHAIFIAVWNLKRAHSEG